MLRNLKIANLAIIENAEVSFEGGFTVLTGATGAGKSLLIDSLSLLLGARASSELIRQGEEKASIVGTFTVSSSRLRGLLDRYEIPVLGDELTIERIISKGKSVIKANGVALSLNALNQLSRCLADIHNQFDFTRIIDPSNYLSLVDGFAFDLLTPYKEAYQLSFAKYVEEKKAYEALLEEKSRVEARADIYRYQYEELKNAALYEGEEEELEREISLLKNFDKINSLTQEASSIAHEDFLDRLYELQKVVGKLASYQSQYQPFQQHLEEKYDALVDEVDSLKKNLGDLDYDPSRYEELLQREVDLSALKRKYKKDYAELLSFRDELKDLLSEEKFGEEALKARKKAVDDAKKDALSKAKDLSKVRQSVAKTIEKDLSSTLKDLLLEAAFRIEFKEGELDEEGMDEVYFYIETNVGEGFKSLDKVVSGGEASRIMLGLKTIFIKSSRVATVIFDEIDTGISGEVAEAVARKIKEIALSTQVIAITHLPQVACLSDHHILIAKAVKDGRTFASVRALNLEEKIEEVAHLISGETITPTQREYAREMVLSK